MDESHTNALSPNSQPCMVCCTPNLSPFTANRQVQVRRKNHSGPHALECRFVKPLWAIFAQANRLSVNPFIPQTQRAFLEGTLFQPRFRRNKDTWCDMTHSVVYYQAWVRWLLCNHIIPYTPKKSQ